MRIILLSILVFLTVLSSGCTHKRLINAGDDYLTQGQYQHAFEKYQRAMNEKPDNVETQQKFEQTKILFEGWLDKVERSAIKAEQNNDFAKAQILYSKLAKHRQTSFYRQKQRELYQQNLKDFGLKIKLAIAQPQLNQTFGHRLDKVKFINTLNTDKMNEIFLAFSIAKVDLSTQTHKDRQSAEYISGYDTIVNPQYQEIQHDIIDQRTYIKELRSQLWEFEQLDNAEYQELLLLKKDQEIAQLNLEKTSAGSSEFKALKKQISNLHIQISKQRLIRSKTEKQLLKTQKKIKKQERNLDNLFDISQHTPELADVPIFTEYQYSVKTVNQLAKSSLTYTVQKGDLANFTREHHLQVKYSDKSHAAHQQIELNKDPLLLKSNNELKQMLYVKGREKVIELILNEVDNYQQKLITTANNEVKISRQLNQWLVAGIVSNHDLPSGTSNKVKQELSAEFGQGGYFKINELLEVD